MLMLPPSVRIYVAMGPMDMRCGFDRLSAAVRHVLKKDPFSGHLFAFFNRVGNRVKLLYWDRDGYCLFYKRIERGRFRLPTAPVPGASHIEMEAVELMLLLDGIEVRRVRRRPRWEPSVWSA